MHPDIAAELVISAARTASMESSDRRTAVPRRRQEAEMLWKIIGVVAIVWIVFAVIGALLEGLFPILMIGAVVFGLYLLYKAVAGSDSSTVGKL